jgi:hypothetical protein
MEKHALAHSCATLDPDTLAFSWIPSMGVQITAAAVQEAVLPKKVKK